MKLQECFNEQPDPRVVGRTTHRLIDILVLTICAVVAGADDWEYVEVWGTEKIDWRRNVIALENGIPSHDTIGRVFAELDSAHFKPVLQSGWHQLHLTVGRSCGH